MAANPARTRLLKAICGDCAYTVRVTRRWLDELGAPLCPCNREPLECAEWEAIKEQRTEQMADYARSISVGSRVLSEKSRIARTRHTCSRCKWECIEIGHEYSIRTMRVGGEIVTEKTCKGCSMKSSRSQSWRSA
jgi:hypothetical protein